MKYKCLCGCKQTFDYHETITIHLFENFVREVKR